MMKTVRSKPLMLLKAQLKTERLVFDAILIYFLKLLYNILMPRQPVNKTIIWTIGCQRSGTSLMNRVFTRDFRVWVYRECSSLSFTEGSNRLRLRPYADVKREIDNNKFSYILAKPLVETQNILEILEYFPNSKALWMYRHYRDFARSNVIRFKAASGNYGLKAILSRDQINWRSQGVSNYVYDTVAKYYSEDMSPHDASALFWFARNQLFFELDLDTNPRVFMCRYKDLVKQPQIMMTSLYAFIGIVNSEQKDFSNEINSQSVGKGGSIVLNPEIEALCESLLNRINEVYFLKYPIFKETGEATPA